MASVDREAGGMIAIAEPGETEELLQLCAGQGFKLRVAPLSRALAEEREHLLFIGHGAATARAVAPLLKGRANYALLIAHDPAVLDFGALIARCTRVLIAPYDDAALAALLAAATGGEADHGMLGLNIVGESPQLRRMLSVVATFARYETPVLLRGDTGTGKELVARGLHYGSSRCDNSFVPVNCCALSDELLLAELFGYEKGAFTDAKRSHAGLVAQAAGGTLFLDEVDSLTPKGQGALLRFLQEQEYRPLGSTSLQHGDVRVISASNKNLETLVSQGRFREDLYYRLHVLHIRIPTLREREGDVAILAAHFLHQFGRRYGQEKRLHPLTLRWMEEYDWPGNVRELENYLHRVFVLTQGPQICVPGIKGDPVHLAAPDEPKARVSFAARSYQEARVRVLEDFEKNYLRDMLEATGGNVSEAARRAGKERRDFGKLLKKHGIERTDFAEHGGASPSPASA